MLKAYDAVAAAEEAAEPTSFPENSPLELNVCSPKLGFFLSRSIIAIAAIVHQQIAN